jgi:hypothetical protein
MKRKTLPLLAILWLSIALQSLALAPKQRIFPSELKKTGTFATETHFADNTLFVSDPEYKTPSAQRGCNIGYGSLAIYKQISGSWSRNQLLLPDYGTSNETKFGRNFSYKNNILVVSSERENHDPTGALNAGAIYVFKRDAESNQFYRIAKLFAPSPGFGAFRGANGVVTNGTKIVVYDTTQSTLYLYNISGSTVTTDFTLNIGMSAGFIKGITDNNIVVIQNKNAVRLFKINGSSLSEIYAPQIPCTGIVSLWEKTAVNGNTIVFETVNVFSSGSRYAGIRIVKLGTSAVESISDIGFPLDLAYNTSASPLLDISVRENSAIAVSFTHGFTSSYAQRVALLYYIDGKYRQTDILEAPVVEYGSVVQNWGASLAMSPTQLFAGDNYDRTIYIGVTGSDQCDSQNGHGVLHVYDLRNMVNSGTGGSRIFTSLFHEQNDGTGGSVATNDIYALVSNRFSDDVNLNAGAVTLLKKRSNVWEFEKKLYDIAGTNGDNFGQSVAMGSNFAVIGASGRSGSRGAVFVYQLLSPTGVAIEDATSMFIGSPDDVEFNYFGTEVATDGNFVAVSAPGDNTQGYASGAVYIFNWNGSFWNYVQKIISPVVSAEQHFGCAISLKGNFLVIGARDDDNAKGTNAGAAYVYVLSGTTFGFSQKLLPPNSGNSQNFGKKLSLAADNLIIASTSGTISNLHPYRRSVNTWNPESVLTLNASALYGPAIAADGSRFIASGVETGKVYRYDRNSFWQKSGTLALSNLGFFTYLSVALNGDNALIGDDASNGAVSGKAYAMNFGSIGGARLFENPLEAETAPVAEETEIYPNPVIKGGIVRLMNYVDIQKVNAYTTTGICVGELAVQKDEIDLSSLESGMYLIHILDNSETKVVKITVE